MQLRNPIVLLLLLAVNPSAALPDATAGLLEASDAYNVPTFDLSDLRAGRRRDDLASVLGTTGLLSVTLGGHTGTPASTSLGRNRNIALGGLCSCAAALSPTGDKASLLLSVPGSDSALLTDGETLRTTVATATIGDAPLPLPRDELVSACGTHEKEEATIVDAMDALRDAIADVSSAFVGAVDGLLRDASCASAPTTASPLPPLLRTDAGASYSTLASIVGASRHLEHFHVYSKESKEHKHENAQEEDDDDDVLRLHTDAGLFLSFIPGMSCKATASSESSQGDGSFFVLDPTDGRTKRVIFPSQPSVAIMLGVGAERWLDVPAESESPLVTLRATRHAVKMQSGERRAWYGMMHLVPDSSIVQVEPRRTFADMRRSVVQASKLSVTGRRFGDDVDDGDEVDVAVGCGNSPPEETYLSSPSEHAVAMPRRSRRRLQHVTDGSACNNSTNFYCWMSCLDIPDAEHAVGHLREGHSLYCLDPAVLAGNGNRVSSAVKPCEDSSTGEPGGAMNPACIGSWQPTAPGVPAQKLNVDPNEGGQDVQYCYGKTSMYMHGFEWQGTQCIVYIFKSWVLNTPGKFAAAAVGTVLFGIALEGAIHLRRTVLAKYKLPAGAGESEPSTSSWIRFLALSTGTYALQLTMGYLIMLVVMTYSAPLFICVILGLAGGHIIFVLVARRKANTSGNSVQCMVPEGCTPCCQNNLDGPAIAAATPPLTSPDSADRSQSYGTCTEETYASCCGGKTEEPFRDEGGTSKETCCGISEGSDTV